MQEIKEIGYLECCKRIFDVLRGIKWGDLELDDHKIADFYELLNDLFSSRDLKSFNTHSLSIINNELLSMAKSTDENE